MTNSINRRQVLATGTAGAMLSLSGMPVRAQETINMVAIDGYPARAMWVQEFSGFFIPRMNELLAEAGNYQIEWQEAYGGQIVRPRGVLEGIKLGLGDIGIVTTIFHNSALPSQAIAGVTPFVCADARIVARAVDEISNEFPATRAEYAAENQVYLATGVVLDTYQMFSTEPISAVSDLEGRRVAGAGVNLRYLEGIEGAAGVRGGLTDFYGLLQNSTVEAAMLWPEAANTFNIVEVAPYMLRADLGAVNSKTVTVNADVWETLPGEIQEMLRMVAIEYRDHIANVAMDRAGESREAFLANGGTIVDLPAEERTAWANAMPNIAVEWAQSLDASGMPGSDMLRAYMQKLRDAGQTPARDWDAELA